MKLKLKISKKDYDDLSEELQKLYYVSDNENEYKLDVDVPDAGPLKRAKDREVERRKEAEKKAEEYKSKLDDFSSDDLRKKGDIETLEKQWKEREEKSEKEHKTKIEKINNRLSEILLDKVVAKVAAVTGHEKIMQPHIKARLKVVGENDEMEVRVLNDKGEETETSFEDLGKFFLDSDDFSSILKSNGSTGSGTPRNIPPSASGENGDKDLSKFSPKELVSHLDAKKNS